jgi:threonine synthase
MNGRVIYYLGKIKNCLNILNTIFKNLLLNITENNNIQIFFLNIIFIFIFIYYLYTSILKNVLKI